MKQKIYITYALRTAIGSFGGALKNLSAVELGSEVIKNLVSRNNLENISFDGIIIGNVLGAGLGQNPARQCAINAGISYSTSCLTINKVCGSSMKAVDVAFRNIQAGYGNIYIAGGIESMSNSPYISQSFRWGKRLGHSQFFDEMIYDGLWCPFNNKHMGELVEDLAVQHGISREDQDYFSYESNSKALNAINSGRFFDEIIPLEVVEKKTTRIFNQDERPRMDSTIDKLSQLKPVFRENGTITAGNSSGICDGAAMLLISSSKALDDFNLNPMAEIIAISEVGLEPELFGIAPVKATYKVCKDAKINLKDIELFEYNEAFAAQILCVLKELGLEKEKVNVNGGAVALGHPIGASGARIIVSLVHEMIKRKNRFGLASLCIGSGEGMAVLLENTLS